jgi:hypothetical protein
VIESETPKIREAEHRELGCFTVKNRSFSDSSNRRSRATCRDRLNVKPEGRDHLGLVHH